MQYLVCKFQEIESKRGSREFLSTERGREYLWEVEQFGIGKEEEKLSINGWESKSDEKGKWLLSLRWKTIGVDRIKQRQQLVD